MIESHTETISCPECKHVQEAEVKYTPMWNVYIRECKSCKYIIMESEWTVTIYLLDQTRLKNIEIAEFYLYFCVINRKGQDHSQPY